MRTHKQKFASRINGAKSSGPVTPDGKARAARNATTHGLSSQVVVLASEDKAAYQQSLRDYYDEWQPVTQTECDLVNDIAAARWRLNRIVALETAALDLELDRGREDFQKKFTRADEATRCAIAYESLSDRSRTLANLARHETRLRRVIERATRQLLELRQQRNQTPPPEQNPTQNNAVQNEPGTGKPGPQLLQIQKPQIEPEAHTSLDTPVRNATIEVERNDAHQPTRT